MPKATFHRFNSPIAFLDACEAAGWLMIAGEVYPPAGVQIAIIGPLIKPPTGGRGGMLPGLIAQGEVIDLRFHVNVTWDGEEVPAAFEASIVTPSTPSQVFALPPVETPPAPAVPEVIASWKGKAWLLQQGHLDAARGVAEAAGPVALLAFQEAAEWSRNSSLLAALAQGLGLTEAEIDAAFIAADGLRG